MKKKIILIICLFLSFSNKVAASIFKGGDVINDMYIVKIDKNGNKEYKKAQFIINEFNEYVYCLEPFIKVNNNVKYDYYEDDFANILGIDNDLWQKINLISYYGYNYQDSIYNHTNPIWYYITQMLIWKEIYPEGLFYFTNTFQGEINIKLYENEINEIYNLVNSHFTIPEFNIPEVYINDTITLKDNLNVLSKYKTGNKNIKLNNNELTIKVTNKEETFTLYKEMNNTNPIIFISNASQNILKGYVNIPVSASYKIIAKKIVGSITIKKYGESLIINDNNHSFGLKEMEGVTYALYNEDNELIKELTTDSSGKITYKNLDLGTYFLKETKTKNGYIIDEVIHKIELTQTNNEKEVSVSLTLINNLEKGKLIIKKKDANNLNPIKDTIFEIIFNDKIIFEGKTNEDGILEIDNLPLGTYIIKEKEPSKGYLKNDEEYIIDIITNKEVKEIEITNIPDTNIDLSLSLIYIKKKYLNLI